MEKRKSHEIALSGVSSAFAIIALTLAIFVEPLTLTFNVVAGLFTILPLTKGYWKGAILSYIVISIVGFFMGNLNSVPYIAFFGFYAILQWVLDTYFVKIKLNKYLVNILEWIIKLAYFQLVIFIFWTFLQAFIADINFFSLDMTYFIVSILGTVLFTVYDIMMHFVFKNLKWFIDKKIKD